MRNTTLLLTILICSFNAGYSYAQNQIKLRDIECYNLGDGRYYCRESKTETPLNGKSKIIDGYTSQYIEVEFKDGIPDGSWKLYQYNKLAEEYTYNKGILNGSYKEYYEDGTTKVSRNYVNGKPDGKFIKYSVNGKVESEVSFKNGKQEGDEIFYDSEGKRRSQASYSEGKTIGRKVQNISSNTGDYILTANYNNDGQYDGEYSEIFTNGNVKLKGQYKNGKKDGTWEIGKKDGKKVRTDVYFNNDKIKETIYYTDNTVEIVRGLKDGKKNGWERKYTYGDGSLKSEIYYQDGEVSSAPSAGASAAGTKSGIVKQTKQISSNIGNYMQSFYQINGKYEGEYTEQWVDGNKGMKTKGQYANGKKTGKWTYENKYGKIQKEETYSNDKLNGTYTTYNENKTPENIYEYKDDEKNGSYKLYRTDGTLRESGTYVNGRIQGEKKEYFNNGTAVRSAWVYSADPSEPVPFKEYFENGKLKYVGVVGGPKGFEYTEEYDNTGKRIK